MTKILDADDPRRLPASVRRARANRLAAVIALYPPEEPVTEPFERYAMVEFDEVTQLYWLETHRSPDAALEYKEADDSEYVPYLLVDLDTGKQWDPVRSYSWQERAAGPVEADAEEVARP